MADIFISYASGDRSRAEPLAKALEKQGWSVWWDRTIPPGKSFDQVIQEAITAAKCVVVLWSEKSIISDWVKEEATIGKRRQILVPAKIDVVDPPLGFGLIQAADLTDWEAESTHASFVGFLSAISDIVGPSPLKIKEAEEKRAEEKRIRKQEQERRLREQEQRKAGEKRKRVSALQRVKEKTKTEPAEKESLITDSITPRKKYLALGIGVAALILVFSGIVIIEFTTPHPPKIVDFEAAPLTIIPHKSSTLRWRTSGAIKVMLNGKKVPLEGEKKVNPSKTSNYKLTATNEDGLTVSDIVTIEVTTPPPPKSTDFETAKKWVDEEFQPSTLTKEEQMKEMEWFTKAAKPFKGMSISVVSETIPTHEYEAKVLTKAFEEITGIKVSFDLVQRGDVIEKLQSQWASGKNLYDAYISESDLIGTHWRYGFAVSLSDFMEGDGKDVTLPTLDIDDFMGKSFTTAPDGKLYQLPDQQYANLYWFRYDWFKRPEFKKKFMELYGYELGVPVNWSAYEDIAEFFTEHIKEIDGKNVFGHNDYGKKSSDLAWRFHDAWLSMAGVGDKGIPNGIPVDEWGIRVDKDSRPVGASVSRGGATNAPAAKYALRKYMEWLRKYAPPGTLGMDFYTNLPVLARGSIAQQIFWYTAFTATMVEPGPTVNLDGTPKWRMAPSPHGPYWEEGMKLGYQDCGSWTFMYNTPLDRRKAAWLFAQFCVCKTTSLKKTHVGLTPIRDSDIRHESFTERAPKLGGLVEFYRSPARVAWTPSGTNVPDYPKLAQLWWLNIGEAVSGEVTVDEAMNNLAKEMDKVMARLERAKTHKIAGPKLNKEKDESYWLNQPGSPKAKMNEKPKGQTVNYDDLIKAWREGRVK